MPVTGIKQVQQNMRRTFRDISDKKAPQFINTVLDIGSNHAKELTPISYSDLIGSIVIDTTVGKAGVEGTVEYMADYAVYLNGTDTYTPLWKPRPLPKDVVKGTRKRKDGTYATPDSGAPATNMDARPRFLNRGFEDPESIQMIEKAKDIFKL